MAQAFGSRKHPHVENAQFIDSTKAQMASKAQNQPFPLRVRYTVARFEGLRLSLRFTVRQLQHRLNGMRIAAKALGHSAEREVFGAKKRVLSAAGRAAIVKAAKKRWAKVRKQAKKVAS